MRISDWSSDVCSSDLFARAIGIADLARLIALQEKELARAFIGVDLGRKRRGVGKLQRHMAFPLRLQRRHVHDDAAPGIGGLAEADHQHIARDAEILDRPRQHERSEEHTSELQSLMRISYAVFCLKKQKTTYQTKNRIKTNDKSNRYTKQ